MTMKKYVQPFTTNLMSLMALFLLFSSFTILTHAPEQAAAIMETKQSFWSAMQDFSFQKLGFWQKTALFLGASSMSYAVAHRHYRRHYDEGIGCLGVIGIIILVPLLIVLIPVFLVIGLVMLIFGIPFSRFNGRHRRHRRQYRRDWN
jgi:hypothetical protein